MKAETGTDAYSWPAVALHWLMAVLILGLFALGLYMRDLHLSPLKLELYNWHKWAGVTAFLLLLLRLAWRAGHRPPDLPASMPAWQRSAARAGHGLLYLLMIAVPLSGWLVSSAQGFQTVYFGVLPIPDLLAKDKVLGELLGAVHEWLNYLTMAVVAGHAAMAVWHHVFERDNVLASMLPWLGDKEGRP